MTSCFPPRRSADLEPSRLAALMRVNLDIFLRTLCLVLAFGIFTSEGAGFGDVVLAGNAILLQFQSFVSYGLDGFAHAAEILAGGARGARNRRAFRAAALACSLWGCVAAGLTRLPPIGRASCRASVCPYV